jgi:hypothetical protein
MVPATALLTAQSSLSEPAAEECKASPGANTPRGAHWYYRINRAKQHCWYLGVVDARANASAVAPTASTSTAPPPPRKGNVAEAPRAAAPPIAPLTTASPVAAAPAAPAPIAAEPAPPERTPPIGFATRWPDNLPNVEDLDEQEPAAISDSYADRRDATDAAAQMPSKWPGVDGDRAAAVSASDTALRYVTIAGMVAIPLVLAVGWGAKFAHGPGRSPLRDQGRTMARQPRRRRGDFAEAAAVETAVATRRGDRDRRVPTPTDPAYDLKTSLAELMRDLRRAGAFDPVPPAARPAHQTDAEDDCPALQAAE